VVTMANISGHIQSTYEKKVECGTIIKKETYVFPNYYCIMSLKVGRGKIHYTLYSDWNIIPNKGKYIGEIKNITKMAETLNRQDYKNIDKQLYGGL
jgi:hypothetical protein